MILTWSPAMQGISEMMVLPLWTEKDINTPFR
jgi:hypothetical protein